ncbi:MAG: SPASM domain-containing protein [Bdellovibrionota bacterium]
MTYPGFIQPVSSHGIQAISHVGGRYAPQKRETIDSFLAFARGEEYPRWPIELFLEISNVCNLKCAMCPTFSALNPHRFSALKEEERGFIDQQLQRPLETLLAHALNVHCFGYGEPTIHPDFKSFISTIADYEVLIDFFTNGMYLTEELAEFLVEKQVHSITVSFSGLTKEEYESVYIGGIYEQVLSGLATLARIKMRNRSMYPYIEINSLAFEHHLARLDRFVELMADHGANKIHLKSLQAHAFIPQLSGHASVLRPWKEGEMLARARLIAAERGLIFSSTQYESTAVATDEAWRSTKMRSRAVPNGDSFEPLVSITRFKTEAKDLNVIRPPAGTAPSAREDMFATPDSELPAALAIGAPRGMKEPFYCFEPFKTVYVRRDGTVKPCCFANNAAPPLGDLTQQEGAEIWNGPRYSLVRDSIMNQRYPLRTCQSCLKDGYGPRDHFTHAQFDFYLAWYRTIFGVELRPSPNRELMELGGNTDIAERYIERHSNVVAPERASGPVPPTLVLHPEVRQVFEEINVRVSLGEDCTSLVRGHLDQVQGTKLFGWAWLPLHPSVRPAIDILDGDEVISTIVANKFRSDLLVAGVGDGHYSFEMRLPFCLHDGNTHQLRARLNGTRFLLRAEPIPVKLLKKG